jgi:hypothetical protein
MGFIQTTIEYALQRDELRYGLLAYLSKLLEQELIMEQPKINDSYYSVVPK